MHALTKWKMVKKGNDLRYKTDQSQTNYDWENFGQWRNKLKQKIKETKTNFYKKFLSSKNDKVIWKIIHGVLKATNTMLKANVS